MLSTRMQERKAGKYYLTMDLGVSSSDGSSGGGVPPHGDSCPGASCGGEQIEEVNEGKMDLGTLKFDWACFTIDQGDWSSST